MSIQDGDRDINWGSVAAYKIHELETIIEKLEKRIDILEGKDDHERIKRFDEVMQRLGKLISEAESNIGTFNKMRRMIEDLVEEVNSLRR